MIANSCNFVKGSARTAAVLASLAVAACAPQPSSPQQVQASNPSVTYKYRSDQELVQADQSAATFCNRYQSVPGTANFTNDPDGSRLVVFECVKTAPAVAEAAVPHPQADPNLTYDYRTDRELLAASRSAQIYCMNRGTQQVISNTVANADGTRTMTFQCGSP